MQNEIERAAHATRSFSIPLNQPGFKAPYNAPALYPDILFSMHILFSVQNPYYFCISSIMASAP